MKPNIDISTTSSQSFFNNKEYDLWTKDDAPILVGIGIRAPENIGAMIRLAGNIACKKVIFVENNENHNLQKIKKTATTAFNKINWRFANYDNWQTHIPSDYKLIALETTSDSKSIYNIQWPQKVAIIVGDERYGIDMDTLDLCYIKLHIPMIGNVKSLNVVQAAAISLFDIVRQRMQE